MQQGTNQTINPYAVLHHVKQLLERIKLKNNINPLNPPMETNINFDEADSFARADYNKKSNQPSSIKIEIGVKNLFNPQNMINGEVPRSEFVNYTEIVFHEERHVQQYISLFQKKKPEKWIVDMARHSIVTRYFPNYYLNNYWNQASEVDAEENGITKTVKYFDTHHLNGNTPKYDARTILLDLKKNSYQWYLPHNQELNSYKEMVDKLQLRKKLITRQLQSATPIIYDTSNPEAIQQYAFSEKFFTSPEYKNHRQAYENATDGIERDKILLQAILREYQHIYGIPKCLEPECKAYLKAFKHTDKSTVIPSSQVYSIMSQEDVHVDRINNLEDKFGNVLAAAEALEHDNSHQLGS